MPRHYILMADVIRSSDKNAHDLMRDFKQISARTNIRFQNEIFSPLTITLGDEFQSVVRSLKAGIDIIFTFEESIVQEKKGFRLRYILHFGQIDTPLIREAAYGMLGPGLLEARNELAALKDSKNRFFFSLANKPLSEKLNLGFRLYQMIVDGWRTEDYPLIGEFLKNQDYKAVAASMEKDRSLVWRRGKSLKISEYFIAKELIYKEICNDA